MAPLYKWRREKASQAMEGSKEEKPKVPPRDPDGGVPGVGEGPQQQPPDVSEMRPLTQEAYGGGMYASEGRKDPARPRASATQSADGPEETPPPPKHAPPPSTGDRDLDVTGQSYIQ